MSLKFELIAITESDWPVDQIAESDWRAGQINKEECGDCLKEDDFSLGAFVEVSDRWNTRERIRNESRLGDLEVPTKLSRSKPGCVPQRRDQSRSRKNRLV